MRALADVGPDIDIALAYLPVMPFGQNLIDRAIRGDYMNLFAVMDLTVPRLKRTCSPGHDGATKMRCWCRRRETPAMTRSTAEPVDRPARTPTRAAARRRPRPAMPGADRAARCQHTVCLRTLESADADPIRPDAVDHLLDRIDRRRRSDGRELPAGTHHAGNRPHHRHPRIAPRRRAVPARERDLSRCPDRQGHRRQADRQRRAGDPDSGHYRRKFPPTLSPRCAACPPSANNTSTYDRAAGHRRTCATDR